MVRDKMHSRDLENLVREEEMEPLLMGIPSYFLPKDLVKFSVIQNMGCSVTDLSELLSWSLSVHDPVGASALSVLV